MNQAVVAVNFAIGALFTICFAYQVFYYVLALLRREKPRAEAEDEAPKHRFAVLVCARNEENVIGHLLESIAGQDYPAELIQTFVIADNCTDGTAQRARECGAEVWERHNDVNVGKGYAMTALIDHIWERYGSEYFDGYFVFDADNLLEPDYIRQMDRTFREGYQIITGYRNSKNYGDNWISAGNGLWFLREAQFLNRPRQLLGTSCTVSGTGFMFSGEVLRRQGGWPFHLMTEDIEFSVSNVLLGTRIGYCGAAMLYDEQPTRFSQSWNQRLRWAKGYLQVFAKFGRRMARRCVTKRDWSCFDIGMCVLPVFTLTAVGMVFNLVMTVLAAVLGRDVGPALGSLMMSLANSYGAMFAMGAVALASEWKKIKAPGWRKLALLFTFPIFQMTYIPISCAALFVDVEWKPIVHARALSMGDLGNAGARREVPSKERAHGMEKVSEAVE